MPWTDRYMAVPFKDGGRSFDQADCLGLYALILLHEACTEMPVFKESVGTDVNGVLRKIENEIVSGRWQRIYGEPKDVAKKFDCIRMTGYPRGSDGVVRRSDIHLGCALGNGKIIHTEDERGPRIIALDDEAIVRRVLGVYRPLFLTKAVA